MSSHGLRKWLLPVHEKSLNCVLSKFGVSLIHDPITLVDVGASGGPIPRFIALKGHTKTVGFEPDEMAFSELIKIQDKETIYLNKALSNKPGEFDFYINKNRATSSFLLADQGFLAEFPNPQDYAPAEIVRKQVTTLDESLSSANIDDVDFIKLDTQGTELYILEGGSKVLTKCFGIEIEVEFYPVYKQQPLFADIDDFLRGQGYILFDIHPIYWKRSIGLEYGKSKGQLVWGEALYFKGDKLFEYLAEKKDIEKFIKVLKAVSLLTLYGYLDYALKMTRELRKTIKDDSTVDDLVTLENCLVKKPLSGWLPTFHHRRKVAKLFYSLFKTFRLGYEKHSIPGEELGNY